MSRARGYRPAAAARKCVVCGEREGEICGVCVRSLADWPHDDGSTASVVRWAAERARRFERKRARTR